ncbi:MAG: SDR family oxidoreductase [Spirochaetaceae bacterium]|nr:SDR family oxidoreductase [Spirochaetaceae bacterium]
MEARRLVDKPALVTGAGSGIGAGIAGLFARHGARVAVADRDADAAQRTVRAILAAGGRAVAITADISTGRGAEGCVDETVAALGGLQIVVNSAGVTPRYAPDDWDYEQVWDWVMAVNLKGTYLVSRRAVQAMSAGGAIVNLSSIYGLVGRPMFFGTGDDPYPPGKHGVIGLTRDMANNFGARGIRVNALCPAFVYSPLTRTLTEDPAWRSQMEAMQPLGRLGTVEEVAYAALFLASDDSSFITGVALPVDGGYTSL